MASSRAQQAPSTRLDARSAAITATAQAAGRGVTLVAVIVSTAIVAHAVGVDTYADWATVLSLVSLTAFALDPGISPVIVRRLSQNPDDAPTPQAMIAVRVVLALLALAVVTAVSVALRGPAVLALAIALGAQVLPRSIVLNAGAWLQADHRLHRQTLLEAACTALGMVALAIAAALDSGVVVLAITGFTAPTVLLALLLRRELARTPSILLTTPGLEQPPRVRAVLVEVAPLAGALLLLTLYTRIFVVFVNAAEDSTEVARYLFAFQFVEQLIVIAGIVAATLLPLLAIRARAVELFADGPTQALLVAVTAVGSLLTALFIALAPFLCRTIGGGNLAPADYYLTLLAPIGAIILPAFLLGYLYVAIGAARRYLWFNAIALAANLIANAALTLTLGATATARIAWATELIVGTLACAAVYASGRSGKLATARMAAIVAAGVVGAELAASGSVPRAACALAIVGCAALAGGREVAEFATRLRRLPTPVGRRGV